MAETNIKYNVENKLLNYSKPHVKKEPATTKGNHLHTTSVIQHTNHFVDEMTHLNKWKNDCEQRHGAWTNMVYTIVYPESISEKIKSIITIE